MSLNLLNTTSCIERLMAFFSLTTNLYTQVSRHKHSLPMSVTMAIFDTIQNYLG